MTDASRSSAHGLGYLPKAGMLALLLFVLGGMATAVVVATLAWNKPVLYPPQLGSSQAVYAAGGELLRLELAADQRYRLWVQAEQLPPALIKATLLYEDRWYYQHNGVNPAALWRAVWSTYISGERRVGASTITMQAARLRFGLNSRNVSGKLQQIWRAWQLEWHYSKTEILGLYFNLAPYGRNVESAAAAALTYFDKPVDQLSVAEALALAVIPQNPNKRNPNTSKGRAHIVEAKQRLLQAWIEQYPEDANKAQRLALPLVYRALEALPLRAPHWVRQQTGLRPNQSQLNTSLDWPLQQAFEQTLSGYVKTHRQRGLHNAAALLVDARSMQVQALLGSADFLDASILGQVDASIARRSPGSTLKPFTYALAFDQGLIQPSSLLEDAPKRYGAYTPENFDRQFAGPISASDALIYSRNLPAVNLLAQLAQKPQQDLYRLLQKAQVHIPKPRQHYGLALTLGGLEVSMLELAQLYATLANDGQWQPLKLAGPEGDVRQPSAKSLLSPEAAWLTLSILRRNLQPQRHSISGQRSKSLPVAWKTGTSWAHRDAWSVGVLGPYVLVVWAGNFDGASNPFLVGRQAAAPLFFQLLDVLASQRPDYQQGLAKQLSPMGLNIKAVQVCAATGDLPNAACPQTKASWFVPGVSPIRLSNVHQRLPIFTAATGVGRAGKRACSHQPGLTQWQVFERWPSHIQRLFQQAGLARRQPPDWFEPCETQAAQLAHRPRITTPDPSLQYSAHQHSGPIPFRASVAADAKQLFWFVDDKFVGVSQPNEALFWLPGAGRFSVAVVDQLGRSDAVQLLVTP